MSNSEDPQMPVKNRSRRVAHHVSRTVAVLMLGSLVILMSLVGFAYVVLSKGDLHLPMLERRVEAEINRNLLNSRVDVGSVSLASKDDNFASVIKLQDLEIRDASGRRLARVPDVVTDFSFIDFVKGRLRPQKITITGAELLLRRDSDGRLNFVADTEEEGASQFETDLFDTVDTIFGHKILSKLTSIDFLDMDVHYFDQLSLRNWNLKDSVISLSKEDDRYAARAILALQSAGKTVTTGIFNGSRTLGDDHADLGFHFTNALPSDVADQVAAFDWLRILDAPISGSMKVALARDGAISGLSGVLEIGAGRITQTPASEQVEFNAAKAYFTYDDKTDGFEFNEVSIDTDAGSVLAEGYANLIRPSGRSVSSMVGQFRFSDLIIDQPGIFDGALAFDAGLVDLRVAFEPLSVDIGKAVLSRKGSVFEIAGSTLAEPDHWKHSYDLKVDRIGKAGLLDLWPTKYIPKTRKWLVENVHQGQLVNVAGGVRAGGGKPDFAVVFDIENAVAKFMRFMPVLQNGLGYGQLTQDDLRLNLISGTVIAPDLGLVVLDGSSLFIPDINVRPVKGEIDVKASGSLTSALHLLDLKPFEYLSKTSLKPDVATGQVKLEGDVRLPLVKGTKPDEVEFDVTARITGVRSEKLVENKVITSLGLGLRARTEGMTLSGPVKLGKISAQARWDLAFGSAREKGSTLNLVADLNDAALKEFNVLLPPKTVSGTSKAKISVALKKDTPPKFALTSDLVGVRLAIPSLNWRKSAGTSGNLQVNGTFGKTPKIDKLSVSTKGLSAQGRVTLKPAGGLDQAVFPNLRVGNWLSTNASIVGTGKTTSRIMTSGGTADLRKVSFANSTSNGTSPLDLTLDKLIVTDAVTLTNFRAKLRNKSGLRGNFTARINGKSKVEGTLFPQKHGSAIEIRSTDGGGVLGASGLFANAKGGDLTLVMLPRAAKGQYDGTIEIEDVRLQGNSPLAAMLNALSVVGLLQQLEGPGIHFSTVEGQFVLKPKGVHLKKASAVGPSMGITLDGWYDAGKKALDFQGVLTPIYILNGPFERLFGKLFGRQKGEGLLGFTYTMTGTTTKPRIAINPLSILTPGLFREIFRKPVPKAATE